MASPVITYEYKDALYLNITNLCPTACSFCIKKEWGMKYRGYDLNFRGKEPSEDEVLSAVSAAFAARKYAELVFCGYGEPTMRFGLVKAVCEKIRKGGTPGADPGMRIRMNTNGLGNLVNGRDITGEMKGLVDSLNVSLNTLDPAQWSALMNPDERYGAGAFRSALEFVSAAAGKIGEVVVTAVDRKGVDLKKIEEFALKNGVQFKLRPQLDED